MTDPFEKEPEPSRPNLKWLIVGAALLAVIEVGTNWPAVSSFAHLPQIAHALGIG